MDSKLFRLPTKPNFYAGTPDPFNPDATGKFSQLPTPDSRYPGFAAQMSDGRLVTDYQPSCSKNVPTGQQFATKEWMTKNATELIRIGRERYAQQNGSGFQLANTVPPPAVVVDCRPDDCSRRLTGAPGGIGIERHGCAAPELFGTWEPNMYNKAPATTAHLTTRYEGGRNTPRG
jgi:hypothetical protein